MHLVCLGCGDSSRRKVRVFARVSLAAVDRGRAGRRSRPATDGGNGGSWAGGGQEERWRVRRRGAVTAFGVGGGGAAELTATLAQQREARESQTPVVGAGSGGSRCGQGRCSVGARGDELIRLLEVVGGLVEGGLGGVVVLGAGAARRSINKEGGR
jgi:hypothetical protein